MVESTALEMRRTWKGTVGSNPTLSANTVFAFGTGIDPAQLGHCLRAFPERLGHVYLSSTRNGRPPSPGAWAAIHRSGLRL